MNKLAKLRAELDALKRDGHAILDREVDGNLSDADDAAFTAIEEKIAAKAAEIETQEALDRRRALLGSVASVPALESVTNEPNPATTGGFHSMAEFGLAVRQACVPGGYQDNRLADLMQSRRKGAASDPHTGGGSAGEGFMVPPEYRDGIWSLVHEQDGLFERTDLEPTEKRQVPHAADQTTPWGAAGVQARWRGESAAMSASKLDTEERNITLHELYVFTAATEELLDDAPRLSNRLNQKSAEAISYKIDESIMNGSGAGQPLGWMNADALVTVAKESGQAAATLDDQNILKMFARLIRVPGDTPIWLANSNTIPQLAALTIGDQPVWLPQNSMAGGIHGTLLGAPIIFTEHAQTLGTVGDIQLISPKGYHALRRSMGPKFASSIHLYFDTNEVAFRWTFRFGGQPHLSAAISPDKGSDTKSHFVALATRA